MSFISKLKQLIGGNQSADINKLSNSPNIVFGSNNQDMTAIYKNGLLINVIPIPQGSLYDSRDVYYEARYIVSDGHKYNLEDVKSIESIKTPKFDNFDSNSLGVCGNMVYALRMKAFRLKNEGKIEASVALLKQMTEMMPVSGILWEKEDYLEFPKLLMSIGEFEAAMTARKCIDNLFETSFNLYKQTHNINIKNAGLLDTDLVEAEYFKGCCSECAKYRGRWFSISGKDKRFPKMPVDYGCTCIGLGFFPVIEGVSEPAYCPKSRNIIEYSNRPFVDDRSKKEKEIHQHHLDSEVFEEIKDNDKADYEKLMQLIPDEMPKSFSAYRRMKMSETDKFLKIAEKAANFGVNIRLSKENKLIIERYNKFEKALKSQK